jgi:hypothetical protein
MNGGVNGTMTSPAWDPGHAPLGTLIFRAGLLTEEQIQDGLREGERTGKRLGEVLVERGLLTEKDVTRLLAKQRSVDFVDLEERPLDRNAAELLRAETARRYRALPFAFENGTPLVAVTDVSDEMTTRAVKDELAREVRFVLAAPDDLATAIAKAYAPVAEPALATVASLAPANGNGEPLEGGFKVRVAPEPSPAAPAEAAPPAEPPAAPPLEPISRELHVIVPSAPPAEHPKPASDIPDAVEASQPEDGPPEAAEGPPVPGVLRAAPPEPETAEAPSAATEAPANGPGQPESETAEAPSPATEAPANGAVPAPQAETPVVETPPAATEPPPAATTEPPPADALNWGGSLGELLIESGLLTSEQLEDALREASRRGRRLGEIVLERGWVHERTLAHCLASQKGLPFASLRDRSPDPEAVKLLPRKTAELYAALPIELDAGLPVVAISDPTNEAAMESVTAAFGSEIRFAVAATSELASALERAYDALEPPPVPTPASEPKTQPTPDPNAPSDSGAAAHGAPSGARKFHVAVRLVNSEAVEVGSYATAAEAEAEAAAVVKRLASAGPAEWPSVRGRFLRPDAIVSVDVVDDA